MTDASAPFGKRPAVIPPAVLAEVAGKVDAIAAADAPAAGPHWGALHKALLKAKVDPHAIMRLVTARDAAQAALMVRWLKGEEIEIAAPAAPELRGALGLGPAG